MFYLDLLKKLYAVNLRNGVKLGLEGMRHLSALYQQPQSHFRSVHVAGSNGKGSVSAKIGKGLEAVYHKVGLYTSPHISSFRERIQINGEMISEADVVRILSEIIDLPGTFFELTTLLAFRYFAEKKVDIAVLETGLGGRLDATNIVVPVLSVITSLSLEHTAILGETLEAIAEEKKGIIKPGVPVILGPRAAPLISPIVKDSPVIVVEEVNRSEFTGVDEENRAIAKKALEFLYIPPRAIQKALTTRLPCRLEKVAYKEQEVILDVAHNPDGLSRLFLELSGDLIVVCGLSSNKDLKGCLEIIKQHAKEIHLVRAPHVRGAPILQLKEVLLAVGMPPEDIFCHQTIEKGMWEACKGNENKKERKEPAQVVVTGTFFIMSEARRFLGLEEARDPIDVNEML